MDYQDGVEENGTEIVDEGTVFERVGCLQNDSI
jgi:hypothetical protein